MVSTRILSTLRGLSTRAGTNVLIALVAVIAVGASTCGPAYYSSSQISILRDNLASAPVLGRGFELTQYGAVGSLLAQVDSEVPGAVGANARFFRPSTRAILAEVLPAGSGTGTSLVWRDGVCGHLILTGRCPDSPNQVAVSRSFARLLGLRAGSTLAATPYGTLTVTAVYSAPTQAADYWFGSAGLGTYFPFENPAGHGSTLQDSMFTPHSTFEAPDAVSAQGEVDVQSVLDGDRIRPGDVGPLTYAMANINADPQLQQFQAVITTDIPQTLTAVRTAWSSLAVPALLVTLQLLGLAWLLLFLLVAETVSARGPEIALAKLRGYGPWRAAVFGLSEPVLILVTALPLGVLAGWAATDVLAGRLLIPGTPVSVTGAAWLAGLAATFGGMVAVGLASLRSLRRPVVDEWRRSSGGAGTRTWVLDAVLLTAAVAGLGELVLTGKVSSAHRSSLSLLVPGLLGLAVAVVASRVLPLVCRLSARTGWPRGLVAFLAVRWVARRPAGSRTTIMLATSFALATFALAGWALDQSNYGRVADATVGAPAVLDVTVPPGADLGQVVDRAAPGAAAAAVEEYSSNGTTTLAVDPPTWGRVVSLGPAARAVLARLDPSEPAPLVIPGTAVRLVLSVTDLVPADSVLDVDVLESGATAPTPVTLTTLPHEGTLTVSARVPGCPCTLQDLAVVPSPQARTTPLSGSLTVSSLQALGASGWAPLGGPDAIQAGNWSSPDRSPIPDQVSDAPGPGFAWSFRLDNDSDATLDYRDQPDPLPAIAASAVTGTGPFSGYGLDGSSLGVDVLATVPVVPGAASSGVVVDRRYAEMAAAGNLSVAQDQVWLGRSASVARVRAGLEAAGVQIDGVQTESGYRSYLTRQGPGLARVLLLGEAAVVAALAGAGAVLGLYLTARRRRYELAALMASGITRRALVVSVAAEQVVVVLFGVVVGVATGVAAGIVALRDVPEFLVVPRSPALAVFPPGATLVVAVAAVVALVVAVSICSAATLAGRVSLDQLREAPQ